MLEPFIVPELTLVGSTDEVVLGSQGVGNDIAGEILIPELEFEAD
jgi:hypothetical protein